MIAHVAGGTETIRVGSGGIMLPNHAPLVIAEQFGTLEALHPGRIDLGLGRAPGTDQLTIRALRRDLTSADTFPQDVLELQHYLADAIPGQAVRAVPGAGTRIPLWILGSSLYGAQLAAMLGLPYAFASHFAPEALLPALEVYRSTFKPSEQLQQPHVMVAANVIVADDDATARWLFTSSQQTFVNIQRGDTWPAPPPIDDIEAYWTPAEKERASAMLHRSYVGSPETVRAGLDRVRRRDRGGRVDRRRRDPRPRGAPSLIRVARDGEGRCVAHLPVTGSAPAAHRGDSWPGATLDLNEVPARDAGPEPIATVA